VAAEASAEEVTLEETETLTDQENSTRQLVLNVSKSVKFLSSQPKEDRFFAKIVLLNKEAINC
jgi:hypothetical protein